jgi:hypothetical protein
LRVVPKTICLTDSPELEATALAVELAVALGLAVPELELELELEPEHPAAASRPVATTATPRRGVIRMLKMFINRFVRDPGDAYRSGS